MSSKPVESIKSSSVADGWGNDEDDGWDDQIDLVDSEMQEEAKKEDPNVQIIVYSQAEIVDQIPMKVKRADEILNLGDEDAVIAILRHFSWN